MRGGKVSYNMVSLSIYIPGLIKGLITWRISARVELSARLAGLKLCCDYMKNFNPG